MNFIFFLPQFSGLYLVSLVVILIGFITFNTVPTSTVHSESISYSSSSLCEESYYENPAPTQNNSTKAEVTLKITNEDVMDGRERQQMNRKNMEGLGEEVSRAPGSTQNLRQGNRDEDVFVASTKM